MERLSDNAKLIIANLEELQEVRAEIRRRYTSELRELEQKYLELNAPIFQRTKDIVTGNLERSRYSLKFWDLTTKYRAQPNGISGFWLTVLRNHPILKALITRPDEAILENLIDIRLNQTSNAADLEPTSLSYTLSFEFSDSNYRHFRNEILSKTYHYAPNRSSSDLYYCSSVGTEIDWCEEDSTRESSFFNFFKPPSLPSEECIRNRGISTKDLSRIKDQIKDDFQLGEILKNEVLPKPVDWFTGKPSTSILAASSEGDDSRDQTASYWEELLVWSAQYGDADAVKAILQDRSVNVNVNWRNVNGHSALDYAVGNGYEAITKDLLQQENTDLTPCLTLLLYAATEGRATIVECLLQHPAIDTQLRDTCPDWPESLSVEPAEDHEPILKLLLCNGGLGINVNYKDVNGCTPLSCAIDHGNVTLVELLLNHPKIDVNTQDLDGSPPLSLAVQSFSSWTDTTDIAQLLIQRRDTDINLRDNRGRTPLCYAARRGNYKVVELLLGRSNIDAGVRDNEESTPLIHAAAGSGEDRVKIIRLLLEREGVDVNARNQEGCSALLIAAQYGYKAIVKELLDRGAGIDVNIRNYYGWTPLTSAAGNGHDEVVKLLLGHNDIKVNQPGAYGKTAVHHATRKHRDSTVKLLQEFRAV